MIIFLDPFCLLFLVIILYQDFRERQIYWWTLPPIFIVLILRGLLTNGINDVLIKTIINLSFITVQLLVLFVWMSIKSKKWVNIINSQIGLGDILFFVAICPAFSLPGFICFYVGSLIIILMAYLILQKINSRTTSEIPLAGAMSALLILCIVFSWLLPEISVMNNSFTL